MDWELIAKVFAGLCVVLIGYIYLSDRNRTETQIADLKKEIQEVRINNRSGFPLARE